MNAPQGITPVAIKPHSSFESMCPASACCCAEVHHPPHLSSFDRERGYAVEESAGSSDEPDLWPSGSSPADRSTGAEAHWHSEASHRIEDNRPPRSSTTCQTGRRPATIRWTPHHSAGACPAPSSASRLHAVSAVRVGRRVILTGRGLCANAGQGL